MSTQPVTIRGDRLVFEEGVSVDDRVEHRLKEKYGQGVFIQDSFESANDELVIKLGTSYPKDVSDRRDRDRVMKFINLGDIDTLYAEPTGEGYFTVELPERSDLKTNAVNRRQEIVNQLDWSTAKAIYDDIYQLNPVRNQLNSLIQIVRWLRRESELSVDRIDDIQRTSNTREYLRVLDNLGFVNLDEEASMVRPGRKMEAAVIEAEQRENSEEESVEKIVIGGIIRDGYHILRDQLGLRMLNHFPKYANSFYYTALQRGRHDVHLDDAALLENLQTEWNEEIDPLQLEDKIEKLEEANVLEREGEYVTGKRDIFDQIRSDSGPSAVTD